MSIHSFIHLLSVHDLIVVEPSSEISGRKLKQKGHEMKRKPDVSNETSQFCGGGWDNNDLSLIVRRRTWVESYRFDRPMMCVVF